MKTTLIAIAAAFLFFAAAPSDVNAQTAQTVCGERAEFVSKLKDGYAEEPVSLGLSSKGAMIEVFASQQGTFSIIVTSPNGVSCLVAAGNSWASVPTQKAEIKL